MIGTPTKVPQGEREAMTRVLAQRPEPIKAAGNEIFVRREYYKLVGRPTLLKGLVF